MRGWQPGELKPKRAGRPKGNAKVNQITALVAKLVDMSAHHKTIVQHWLGDPDAAEDVETAIRYLKRLFDAVKDLPDVRRNADTYDQKPTQRLIQHRRNLPF